MGNLGKRYKRKFNYNGLFLPPKQFLLPNTINIKYTTKRVLIFLYLNGKI